MKKQIIHKVRNPFMCRVGQFSEGKQELCIGLDYRAIKSTEQFKCFIGNNDRITYTIDSKEALKIGQEWNNAEGKLVLIVPLRIAKKGQEYIEQGSLGVAQGMSKFAGTPEWEQLRVKLHSK